MLRLCSLTLLVFATSGAFVRADDSSITGYWAAVVKRPDKERRYIFDLRQEGKNVGGFMISPRTRAYRISSGALDGGVVELEIKRPYKGEEVTFAIRGEIADNGVIEGNVKRSGEDFGSLRMERHPSPVGRWKARAESENGTHESIVELRRGKEGLTGHVEIGDRKVELHRAGFRGEGVTFALAVPTDEGEMPVVVVVRFEGENTLKGEWFVPNEREEHVDEPKAEEERVRRSGRFTAERIGAPKTAPKQEPKKETKQEPKGFQIVGTWETVAVTDQGERPGRIVVEEKEGKLVVRYQNEEGVDHEQAKHVSLEVGEKAAEFALTLNFDGNEVPLEIRVEFKGENELAGKWKVDDDAVDFSGAWRAKRVVAAAKPEEPKKSDAPEKPKKKRVVDL